MTSVLLARDAGEKGSRVARSVDVSGWWCEGRCWFRELAWGPARAVQGVGRPSGLRTREPPGIGANRGCVWVRV